VTAPAKEKTDVEVETKQLEGGQVELDIRVPAEPVRKIREKVVSTFVRRANIPGFRKGKAPRAVVERFMDQDALKEQIIDSLLSDAYDAALEKTGIKALDRAVIADQELTEDGALTFKATVTVRPEITLGEYKGIEVTRQITPVTDEQVNTELERLRSRRAQYGDLPEGGVIEKGDLVVVDYDMSVDGEKREDASASGYPLEVGADQLFPELNDILVGARPDDTKELQVTYPEGHTDASLAGKTATFQVSVKQARRRQLPELSDEFAVQVSGLETADALRERIRQNLEAIGKAIAEEGVRDQLIRTLAEGATLDVPHTIVSRETDRRIDEVTDELERRNLTLHQYLQQTNRSFEDWKADLEADARQIARRALILDEIGEREKIEVADGELHAEIHRLAEAEHIDEERLRQRLHDSGELTRVYNRLYHHKILQFLEDNAQVTEETVESASDVEQTPEQSAGTAEPATEG
jgi:trigger factor